jgi:hypothetical protein
LMELDRLPGDWDKQHLPDMLGGRGENVNVRQ